MSKDLRGNYDLGILAGVTQERERIIKLFKANIMWIEALEYDYYADKLADLITGKDSGRESEDE